MKIVVVDFAASEGGALTVLNDFYQSVQKYGKNHEWNFFLSDYYIKENKNINVHIIRKNKINRLFFDNYKGSRIINQLKPDVIINFQNTYIKNVKAPQIIYLHQSLPFQRQINYSFFKKNEFKYAVIQKVLGNNIINGLPKADKVIVQTEWMKNAILDSTKMDSKKIDVIAPDIKLDVRIPENNELNNNYFFYPTSDLSYKNIGILDEASDLIKELNFKIYITIDWKINNKHICSIGQISRKEVFNMYSKTILIFPSKIETFGLPLAEARAMNSIILASNTDFSREVLRNYNNAYFFDPNDPNSLAKIMKSCINHSIFKKSNNKEKTLINNNSWKSIIDIILKVGLN